MTAALIIASGKTNGRSHFLPEKKIGTISAIERVALIYQKAGIQRIVVVCEEDNPTKKRIVPMNLTFLSAPADNEMFDNIKIGIQYLQDKCSSVLISFVDAPMFSVRTIHALTEHSEDLCIPAHHGQCGHPILLPAQYFPQILSYHGSQGLQGATSACNIPRKIIPVDDSGILSDIQKDSSYKKLVATHDVSKLHITSEFQIWKESSFYNSSVHHLLRLTEELGSLAEACRYVGISYSKGRKIVHTIEEQLGSPIIESQQGGKGGGFSRLTKEALDIMQRYDAFCMEAEKNIQELFEKHFYGLI